MTSVDEALVAASLLGGPLQAGTRLVSLDQVLRFKLYVRVVLPIDGYVFWVRASQASGSAVVNATAVNAFMLNQPELDGQVPRYDFEAQGSVHYATDSRQEEAASISINRVSFTSLKAVQDLNMVGGDLLYIAEFDPPQPGGGEVPATTTAIRFAFSTRGTYYQQANLWHYRGDAVYPTMATQIVDDARLLSNLQIISNSLPVWLAYNQYNPPWPVPVRRPPVNLYPSFLVPENLNPPYVAVHITPGATLSMQAQPDVDFLTNQSQLAADQVRLTMYGLNNNAAQSLLVSLMQYSFDTQTFGITNMPVVRDDKETQSDLDTLAQKKVIDFEVSYTQGVARDVAQRLITSCTPTIYADNIPV